MGGLLALWLCSPVVSAEAMWNRSSMPDRESSVQPWVSSSPTWGWNLTATVEQEREQAEAEGPVRAQGSSQYEGAVRGVDIRAVQTQATDGPTLVSTAAAGRIAATSVSVGFAFTSTSVINDDVLAASVVTAKHSRWCGQDIEAGDVLIHGPQALHTASNPEGFAVTFAVVPTQDVRAASLSLGSGIEHLTGRFVRLPSTPATRRLGSTVAGAFRATPESHLFVPPPLASMPAVVADAIDASSHHLEAPRRESISDDAIVAVCVDLAEATGRPPGIAEMRVAAHVSERRLRTAFVQTYGVPPIVFFRRWALDRAYRQLTGQGNQSITVTETAMGLGFGHLGRFAKYYNLQFGERPSETLARSSGRPPLG